MSRVSRNPTRLKQEKKLPKTADRANVRNGLMLDQGIVEQIQRAILEQRLLPGAQLTEERLAEVFGVSRARIRRALLRLSETQSVVLLPNRGAFVAQPTPEEVHEVFEARRIIEAHIVLQAAKRMTEEQKQQLEAHLKLEQQAHKNNDTRAAIRLSGEFHLLLAEVADNLVLMRFLRDLVSQSSLALALYGNPNQPSCGEDEHERLLSAISSGFEDEAIALMNSHLESIERWLRFTPITVGEVDLEQVFGVS